MRKVVPGVPVNDDSDAPLEEDSYKKPIVPVSVQHRVVRVGVVFVTVEVVNAAKMANLHVGSD